jgi:hypothetical protein
MMTLAVLALTPAIASAQFQFNSHRGLNPPTWPTPRDNDPFFGNETFERFPMYGRGDFDRNFYLFAGHGPNDFNGTPQSINRGEGRFRRHPTDGITDPALLAARGRDQRDRGIGLGSAAWGFGTGSGNQYAGIGAYNYGTTAGLGVLWGGLGDYMAGQGQYLQGAGVYNHSNSLANINNEEAEGLDIRNDEYAADAFFNKRLANLASRRQEDDARMAMVNRLSSEQLFRMSKERAPQRLRNTEHDSLTGEITWPGVLQSPQFAAARNTLDALFAKRQRVPDRTGLGSENYREIREQTETLERQLRADMDRLTPMEYVAAKDFLRSLEFEAQQPAVAGAEALAAELAHLR